MQHLISPWPKLQNIKEKLVDTRYANTQLKKKNLKICIAVKYLFTLPLEFIFT